MEKERERGKKTTGKETNKRQSQADLASKENWTKKPEGGRKLVAGVSEIFNLLHQWPFGVWSRRGHAEILSLPSMAFPPELFYVLLCRIYTRYIVGIYVVALVLPALSNMTR